MKKNLLFAFIFVALIVPGFFVSASTGTIDSSHKYAWSTNGGWINFGCADCNVQITDSVIAGYAWSQNYGWINLNPFTSGVRNNGSGVLSGKAWGQNSGWINFSGVSINSQGNFTGTASGDIIGTVNFDCTDSGCPITTDWRITTGGTGGGGGGGCLSNSQCGSDGYVGSQVCQTGDTGNVYQNYVTYVCNMSFHMCSNSTSLRLKSACDSGKTCFNGNCVTCAYDSDCGADNYTGSLFCKTGDTKNLYQNYTTYKCLDAGTASSTCLSSESLKIKSVCDSGETCKGGSCVGSAPACSFNSDCGTNKYTDSPVCQDGNVYQNYITYTCDNPGLLKAACSNSVSAKLKKTCLSGEGCNDGNCVACSHDSDCGTSNYTGSFFCKNGDDVNVYQNYVTYTCNNPGTLSAACSNFTEAKTQTVCLSDQKCSNGSCVNPETIPVTPPTPEIPLVPSIPGSGRHTACNSDKKCISISGMGSDECRENKDCDLGINTITKDPVATIDSAVTKTINVIESQVPVPVKVVVEQAKKVIQSPEGAAVTKTVSTVGAAVTVAATAGSIPFGLLVLPIRLLGLLMTALGIKKRIVPWGVAYDSVTKRPLDPAYITLKNLQGVTVSSAITDLDGRYGFLVPPGVYNMEAHKTNYNFPSQRLLGKTHDELYANIYFGENIEIKREGEVIIKNIPLDPLKFDWNEFEKKNKNLMKFYSEWDVWWRKVYDFSFIIGFVVAFVGFIFAPYPYNTIIMLLYVLMLLFRVFGLRPKSYGNITDISTGIPLSFAIIRVISPGDQGQPDREIASKSADKYGKYYCLVPPGRYYVKIEKKNGDGTYSLVYTSSVIDVSKKGIIKEKFKI